MYIRSIQAVCHDMDATGAAAFDAADSNSRKRPRSDFVTDTPDYKQTKTIITKRQERVRKKFSLNTVVPDTPVKSDACNSHAGVGGGGGGGGITRHQDRIAEGDEPTSHVPTLSLRSTEISSSRSGALPTSLITRFSHYSPLKPLF